MLLLSRWRPHRVRFHSQRIVFGYGGIICNSKNQCVHKHTHACTVSPDLASCFLIQHHRPPADPSPTPPPVPQPDCPPQSPCRLLFPVTSQKSSPPSWLGCAEDASTAMGVSATPMEPSMGTSPLSVGWRLRFSFTMT